MTTVRPVFTSAGAARYSPRYRDHRQQVKLDIQKLAMVINHPQKYQAFIETLAPSRGDQKMKRIKV